MIFLNTNTLWNGQGSPLNCLHLSVQNMVGSQLSVICSSAPAARRSSVPVCSPPVTLAGVSMKSRLQFCPHRKVLWSWWQPVVEHLPSMCRVLDRPSVPANDGLFYVGYGEVRWSLPPWPWLFSLCSRWTAVFRLQNKESSFWRPKIWKSLPSKLHSVPSLH